MKTTQELYALSLIAQFKVLVFSMKGALWPLK
jgi:hypothetical protein